LEETQHHKNWKIPK